MEPHHRIVVRCRDRRWEVSVDGVTRRLTDWFCSRERALAHAWEQVDTLDDLPCEIALERSDGTVEQLVAAA